jgi:hypothetical protein
MKKIIASLFIVPCMIQGLSAQMIPDVTETNSCTTMDNTFNLYNTLDSRKVVLVVASGYDCSICMSHAATIASFADDNKMDVAVIGAMNYKYNSKAPSCDLLTNWKSTYNWNSVFMFNDDDKSWADGGYPTYTVIDPDTKKAVLVTSSINTAKAKALELVAIVASISSKDSYAKSSTVFYNNGQLNFKNFHSKIIQASIFSTSGVLLERMEVTNGYSVSKTLNKGVYIISVQSEKSTESIKLFVNE